ncbi:MAG: M55 family metallopeptidase [Candidatus Cloacimonadia bacterium]
MRYFLSVDMEGVPGTWNWAQEKTDRGSVKKAMFEHTKDVVEAILETDDQRKIKEIIIADSHSAGDNLSYEITALDRRINLISGLPRSNYMMPGFSEEISAVFFIGYHAGAGTLLANMDHTYANRRIHQIKVNGQIVNEPLINAAYAGTFDVPVIFISGDLALKNQLENTPLNNAEYVVTKEALSKFAVKNYSQIRVREETKEKVKKAISRIPNLSSLYKVESPVTLEMKFNSASFADVAALIPYTKRLDGRTIQFVHDDYRTIFDTLMSITTISYTVDP